MRVLISTAESKVIKNAKKLRRIWKIKDEIPFLTFMTKVLIFLE